MIFISILGWALAGALVGFVATRLVDLRGDDPRLSIALAALTAVVGAGMYNWVSGAPAAFINVWALLVAVMVATAAVAAWHLVRGRAPYRRPSVRRSY
jgi:hypothetical protein